MQDGEQVRLCCRAKLFPQSLSPAWRALIQPRKCKSKQQHQRRQHRGEKGAFKGRWARGQRESVFSHFLLPISLGSPCPRHAVSEGSVCSCWSQQSRRDVPQGQGLVRSSPCKNKRSLSFPESEGSGHWGAPASSSCTSGAEAPAQGGLIPAALTEQRQQRLSPVTSGGVFPEELLLTGSLLPSCAAAVLPPATLAPAQNLPRAASDIGHPLPYNSPKNPTQDETKSIQARSQDALKPTCPKEPPPSLRGVNEMIASAKLLQKNPAALPFQYL